MKGRQQQQQKAQHVSLLFTALKTAAAGYGIRWLVKNPVAFWWQRDLQDPLLLLLAVLLVYAIVQVSGELWKRLQRLILFVRAVSGDDTKGSAAWLSVKEAKAAGLHKRQPGSRFAGILHHIPLWLWTETHHLVIGPAGSAKSSAAIFNILASIRHSCLISDIKKEIHEVMVPLQRLMGYMIVKLDPTDPHSDCINPLDEVAKYLKAGSADAITLASGFALQLIPEPRTEDQNKFFRIGARLLITGLILAAIVADPPGKATLARVYLALTNPAVLGDILDAAMKSNALNGDVAARAQDIHEMAFGDTEADSYEQFRIGAVNVMEVFGPGNHLHRITGKTTFNFDQLKTERIACYLMIDYGNIEILAPWSGLMQYLASRQMVASGNNIPVTFVLDEFCNAPLHILPKILTLLRTYGVRCVMATQDVADITRVYGKDAWATIDAETDIKQFLSGIRGKATLEFLSSYLGKFTQVTESFNLSPEGPRENLGRDGRPLLMPDEIRRMFKEQQIIILGNLKPILAKRVQIFAIAPWRRRIGINRLYGKKRFLLPVQVRLFWRWSWVTKHARVPVQRSRSLRRVVLYILSGLLPSRAIAVLGGLVLAVWLLGFPYVLWEYRYQGPKGHPTYYTWCRYIGPKPLITHGGTCPLLLLRKDW